MRQCKFSRAATLKETLTPTLKRTPTPPRPVTPTNTPNSSVRSWRGCVSFPGYEDFSQEFNVSSAMDSEEEIMAFAERKRFLSVQRGDEEKAEEHFQKYLEWRSKYQGTQLRLEVFYQDIIDRVGRDYYDWIVASETAKQAHHDDAKEPFCLPRLMRTHTLEDGIDACDIEGHRIFHMLPAQIDRQICSLETYALALALYFDRKLCRDSVETVTLLIDVRSGRGWANPKALELRSFMEETAKLLSTLFPDRLHQVIVFPLPRLLIWIVNKIAEAVFEPEEAAKLTVLYGDAGIDSHAPMEELWEYIPKDVALKCEWERLASFAASE